MQKRVRKSHIKAFAFSEMFVLILATVALAFVLNEANPVSAAASPSSSATFWRFKDSGSIYAVEKGKTYKYWGVGKGKTVNGWEDITSLPNLQKFSAKTGFEKVAYASLGPEEKSSTLAADAAAAAAVEMIRIYTKKGVEDVYGISSYGTIYKLDKYGSVIERTNAPGYTTETELTKAGFVGQSVSQAGKSKSIIETGTTNTAGGGGIWGAIAGVYATTVKFWGAPLESISKSDVWQGITKAGTTVQPTVKTASLEKINNLRELSAEQKKDSAARQKVIDDAKNNLPTGDAEGVESVIAGQKYIKFGTGYKVDGKFGPDGKTPLVISNEEYAKLGGGVGGKSVDEPFKSTITGTGFVGHLVDGVVAGVAAYALGSQLAKMFKMSSDQTKAFSSSLGFGALAYHLFQSSTTKGTLAGAKTWGMSPTVWGIGIGVIYFLYKYKMEGTNTITFSCLPYEQPLGGAKCEECNKYPFRPCSEYRCRSLGQACQLLNSETSGKEVCAWINPKDVNSPTITPWVDVLAPLGLSYVSDTSIRPPALGVKVIRGSAANQCLQAFTLLQFGINTNEPAQCKVDFNNTAKFDQMQFYFGESNIYEYNHTQIMRMPGPDAFTTNTTEGGSPIFKNDGTTQLFVRCMDYNGNYNEDAYSVKFCVDPSPDTTPPQIEGTSITSGSPIAFGTLNTSIEVYINEPSECKWSIESKAYEQMENTMSCATSAGEINALLSYTCTAKLTGLKNDAENKYYFRCKDQPGKEENVRNVMVQSYEYILMGSQPLNIISVGPNETVTGGTSAVTVDLELETANGAEEGKAWCYFSPSGMNNSYVQMFETDNYMHKQTLQLTPDYYTYYFRCTDLGGNSVEAKTNFTVFSDTVSPQIARVYREAGVGLKIVTDEDAECVYSLSDCNFEFETGLPAAYTNPSIKSNSYVEWKPNTVYYVKCRDLYGNEPNPGECSKIVKPVESMRVVA